MKKQINIEIVKGTLLQTNNYVIGDENFVVLIEASASLENIKKVVSKRQVLAILLTHGHWDHYENLEAIQKEFGCKVYCTKAAFDKINYGRKIRPFDRCPKVDIKEGDYEFIGGGQVLKFNEFNFLVLSTPGHTSCGVSFLFENCIFTGDTLLCGCVGRTDLPTGSQEDLFASLKKLLSLDEKITVFPGHGELTNIKAEKETFISLF